MAVDLETKIKEFQEENKISRKGQLSAVLQLTRFAGDKPFPFKPDDFLAKSKGQISKLSGPNCSKILQEYGITRRLAEEAGRTSRGTIDLMGKYISFLNVLGELGILDLKRIEQYWVERIKDYFNKM